MLSPQEKVLILIHHSTGQDNCRLIKEPDLELYGAAQHWDHREDDTDYFTQPGELFRLMDSNQQQVLFENTARSMADSHIEIKKRHIRHCLQADPAYGEGVAGALGISLDDIA